MKPSTGPRWPWVLAIGVGVAVGWAVASALPGAACVDGASSSAIGHRGACSYHHGVSSGSGWLGVPAGLLAGAGTLSGIEALLVAREARRRARDTRAWEERPRAAASGTAAQMAHHPGEDLQAFLRRVMDAGRWVSFQYSDEPMAQPRERTVRPRWLQLGDVAGSRTLCLVGDCSVDGQRLFALSRMLHVRAVEPKPA